MKKFWLSAWLFCGSLTAEAIASNPFAPPLGERPPVGTSRTQMLTLGSVHLSGHSEKWKAEWLEPLLAKLQAWKPDVITVESVSGEQCEQLRSRPVTFGSVFNGYCRDVGALQRSLGMTQAQARAEADKRLAAWPATPTAVQRRELAMLFLAAGDLASGYVQWWRLPEPERHADDTLTESAVKLLNRSSGGLNESLDIGARLAARIGLERVYAVDDHTSDAVYDNLPAAFNEWQRAHWAEGRAHPSALAREDDRLEAQVADGSTLLAYYRFLNTKAAANEMVQRDFGSAIANPGPQQYGRIYVAWWETRNMRMAANIRESISHSPGARVLNIVGTSHKLWFDQWARQMSDVDVVDQQAILGR